MSAYDDLTEERFSKVSHDLHWPTPRISIVDRLAEEFRIGVIDRAAREAALRSVKGGAA
jgi:hypothetical protein